MYDILTNHKVCQLRVSAAQDIGTANQLAIDLQEINSAGIRERSTELLVIIEVSDINGGTLTIVGIDAVPGSTEFDLDYATAEAITANGLYLIEISNIKGEFKLRSTVADAAVTWSAVGVSFNPQRRPVVQTDGTELAVTYGTTVPVASSSPSVSASRSPSVSPSVSTSISPSVSASVSSSASISPSVSASVSPSISPSRSASISPSVSVSSSPSA
jgi:hypothetical protein